MKKILPLGADEIIALAALVLGVLFNQSPFFSGLGALAVIYLFICVAMRKYEDVLRRQKK